VASQENGKFYNHSLVINRRGQLVHTYEKVHLFRLMDEEKYLQPGKEAKPFSLAEPIYGVKGLCLLGETSGFPIVTDPSAAEAVLKVVEKILGIKIDLSKLDEKIREMHKFTKKLEELQQEAIRQMKPKMKTSEELGYIG